MIIVLIIPQYNYISKRTKVNENIRINKTYVTNLVRNSAFCLNVTKQSFRLVEFYFVNIFYWSHL